MTERLVASFLNPQFTLTPEYENQKDENLKNESQKDGYQQDESRRMETKEWEPEDEIEKDEDEVVTTLCEVTGGHAIAIPTLGSKRRSSSTTISRSSVGSNMDCGVDRCGETPGVALSANHSTPANSVLIFTNTLYDTKPSSGFTNTESCKRL